MHGLLQVVSHHRTGQIGEMAGWRALETINFNKANAWTLAGGVTSSDWANWGDGWLADFRDY